MRCMRMAAKNALEGECDKEGTSVSVCAFYIMFWCAIHECMDFYLFIYPPPPPWPTSGLCIPRGRGSRVPEARDLPLTADTGSCELFWGVKH